MAAHMFVNLFKKLSSFFKSVRVTFEGVIFKPEIVFEFPFINSEEPFNMSLKRKL